MAEAETEVEAEARKRVLSDAARSFANSHGLDSGGECRHDIECVSDLLAGRATSPSFRYLHDHYQLVSRFGPGL